MGELGKISVGVYNSLSVILKKKFFHGSPEKKKKKLSTAIQRVYYNIVPITTFV